MNNNSAGLAVHEVLAAVLQVREGKLQVLLWQRAIEPDAGRWALPGGRLGATEDVQTSVLRQLAEKVDVREVAHIEQLQVFSAPGRMPETRTVASAKSAASAHCVSSAAANRFPGVRTGSEGKSRFAAMP